jgi:uncharacterized protein YbaP (TraB family)
MNKRVGLVAAAVTLAAVVGCKSHDAAPANGSGSGTASDPWAKTQGSAPAGSGTTTATPPKDKPVAPTAKLTKPFFFHGTKDGFHDVWLFGTIHLGVDPQAVPDVVLAKLDGATSFAMEADINDPSLLKSIMRDDGKTLEQELGPETWKKFVAAVGESMANNFQNMKTSAAATVLDVQGMPMTQPIDLFLLLRAKKAGKHVVFLEAAAKQLALLDKWMDVRALKAMLEELDEQKQKNMELITAYVAGDDAKAIEMSKDDTDFIKQGRTHEEFQQMMKELLLDRNASWIAGIEDMAKQGDAFVAVGAMHLLGPGSVPELLTKSGWKIERVTP